MGKQNKIWLPVSLCRQVKLPLISDLLDLVDVETACRAEEASRAARRAREELLPGYSRPRDFTSSSSFSAANARCGGQTRRWEKQQQQQQHLAAPRRGTSPSSPTPSAHGGTAACENTTTGGGVVCVETGESGGAIGATTRPIEAAAPTGTWNINDGRQDTIPSSTIPTEARHKDSITNPPTTTTTTTVTKSTIFSGGGGFGFELVFPFNEQSRDHARRLSENARAGRERDTKVLTPHRKGYHCRSHGKGIADGGVGGGC